MAKIDIPQLKAVFENSNTLIIYNWEVEDSKRKNIFYPINSKGSDWCSAMGGCVATARRHSLLGLPRLL